MPFFPNLFDLDKQRQIPVELTKQKAVEIYTATPQNNDYWDVRHHIAELLNFCEFVTTAYTQRVADEQTIDRSLKQSLRRIADTLKNYLEVVQERRGYQPWKPYLEVISTWSDKSVDIRDRTA
jgi:hypothetical protein